MPEAHPHDPDSTRETFARFGLAAYQAQCVEKQLAILLASAHNPGFLSVEPDKRERFFQVEFEKSLGQLVRRLRERVSINPDLEERLRRALSLRNWLMHDYFWDRAAEVMTPSGQSRMIPELQEAADFLATVDEELTEISKAWYVRLDGSLEEVEAGVDELNRESSRRASP